MKRTTISLMLAFSTMFGLTACGPEQVDSPEAPATGENTAALLCPGPGGYYYCPSNPDVRFEFYAPACAGGIEQTAPYVRADCVDSCGGPCTLVSL
ncbi:hypothetical protein [Myxococcus virescens]|uniref:Lipoprotein n=1 Tax=Myxococcus virescens TaxID=83456 RepID=A0A511H8D1_9BACT|nr:hypothetical protein [Myxococcus virescens]GEL68999.1 hypothetical protein MVI01_07830 [Myxococcus virescens]SDD38180.1 hypothetical protein SAMN04488504_101661 [Myxococcus virescens]